ncbi:MAG: LysR substrate-binding domain-containing protein [Pseudomonadota bacterium]
MARSHLPLNGLRAFEVFARQGRMTLAADELCVTHGAVSRQIKTLEAALGVALTEGPRNRLRLTEAGRGLAGALTPLFDGLEAALPSPDRERWVLEVCCVGTLATKWLIPRLPLFLERNPGASVRIVDGNGPTSEINFALQLGHDAPSDAAEVTPFLRRYHGPVLTARPGSTPPEAAEIMALPRLISRTYRGEWVHWAQGAGVELTAPIRTVEFDRYLHTMGAASAGIGTAIASWFAVKSEIETGALTAPLGFIEALTPCVFVSARPHADPLADRFRDWLIEEGDRSPSPADVRRPPLANHRRAL